MSSTTENIDIKNIFKEKFPEAEWGNNGSVKIYESMAQEYNSLKKGVGIRNISGHTLLKITGDETLDFLHRISTNSLKNLDLFKHQTTLFTTEKGRMIDRATLIRFGEFFLLLGSPDEDDILKSWIEKYIIMEDIKVETVTGDYTFLELVGPQSKSYMTFLCGNKIEQLNDSSLIMGDTDGIKTYITKVTDIRNIEKYWVICESKYTPGLIDYIKENKSVFNFNFIGEYAYDYSELKTDFRHIQMK